MYMYQYLVRYYSFFMSYGTYRDWILREQLVPLRCLLHCDVTNILPGPKRGAGFIYQVWFINILMILCNDWYHLLSRSSFMSSVWLQSANVSQRHAVARFLDRLQRDVERIYMLFWRFTDVIISKFSIIALPRAYRIDSRCRSLLRRVKRKKITCVLSYMLLPDVVVCCLARVAVWRQETRARVSPVFRQC